MVLSYKRLVKNALKFFFIAVFLGCLYAIVVYGLSGDLYYALPVIVFCLYGYLHVHSFRMHLKKSEIIWEDYFYKKIIEYDDVIKVKFRNKAFEIKTSNKRIKITTDIENQAKAIEYLFNKLKQKNENLSVEGNENSYDIF